jgi:hypothetical protein
VKQRPELMACFRNQDTGRKEAKPESNMNGGALALASRCAGLLGAPVLEIPTRVALEPGPR